MDVWDEIKDMLPYLIPLFIVNLTLPIMAG